MPGPRKAGDDVPLMCRAGKVPHLLISDAAPPFRAAWEPCYRPNRKSQKYADHASMIHLDGNGNNNMMESLNRELGRRMRPTRFVSEEAAAAAERVRLFYNFFHGHSGLGNRTPAEAAIVVQGGNRWTTLLRNAHAKVAGWRRPAPARRDGRGSVCAGSGFGRKRAPMRRAKEPVRVPDASAARRGTVFAANPRLSSALENSPTTHITCIRFEYETRIPDATEGPALKRVMLNIDSTFTERLHPDARTLEDAGITVPAFSLRFGAMR